MILRRFLFLVEFEPIVILIKRITKKKTVYAIVICKSNPRFKEILLHLRGNCCATSKGISDIRDLKHVLRMIALKYPGKVNS